MKCFLIAKLNIKNYKKRNNFFLFIILCCVIMYLTTTSISNGFYSLGNSYKTNDLSLKNVELWPKNGNFDSTTMKKIEKESHVIHASQYYNIELNQSYVLEIDGVEINCLPFVRGTNRNFDFASLTLMEELKNNQPIISGRNFVGGDEKKAVIDENTCYILGYSVESILGKKITIKLSDITIPNIEIVGVSSYLYGYYYEDLKGIDEYSKQSYIESELCSPVFFSDDLITDISKSQDLSGWSYENFIVNIDSTDNVLSFCETAQKEYEYDYLNMVASIEAKEKSVHSLCIFLEILSVIIFAITLVSIINSLIIKIDQQKNFSDMLLKLGYRKKHIIISNIIENLYVTFKAESIGLVVSFIISVGIDIFMSSGYADIVQDKKFIFVMHLPEALIMLAIMLLIITSVTLIVSTVQINNLFKNKK